MKSFLLALLAAAPLAAHAQAPGNPYAPSHQEIQQQQATQQLEDQRRSAASAEYQQRNGGGGGTYYRPVRPPRPGSWNAYPGLLSSKEKKDAWRADRDAHRAKKERAKENEERAEARREDEKLHGKRLPGGYRSLKNGDLVKPDGTVVGEHSPPASKQPAKKQEPENKFPEIDPNNSLGKLREVNRQEEARRKQQGK